MNQNANSKTETVDISNPASSSLIDDSFLEQKNPGTYEDLHKKTKDVIPAIFEGFRFTLNKSISSHFQVSHSLLLSSVMPSTYKFGTTYVGPNQVSPQESYPILLGDIDGSGNLNANLIHQFSKNLRTRVVAQIQEQQLAAFQMTNDFKGRDFTASLTNVNTDLVQNSGVLIAHYLQRITQNLDLGTELIVQYGKNVPNNRMALYSIGWRYFGKQWQFSGTLNPLGALHLCYYHQSTSPIQFGVEVESNVRTMESLSTFGYQIDLNKANLTFRGTADSNWTVGAVLEKRLLPLPFTLTLSGFLNHVKPSYRFGIGLTVG